MSIDIFMISEQAARALGESQATNEFLAHIRYSVCGCCEVQALRCRGKQQQGAVEEVHAIIEC